MQQPLLHSKVAQGVSFSVMLMGLIAFAYTGNYLYIGLPFGFLFFLLLGLNWKSAYWIFLFTIPVSLDVNFFGNTLSTSIPDEPIMWMFLLLFMIMMARQPNMLPKWWLRHPIVFITALQFLWLLVAVYYSKEQLYSIKFLVAKTWFLVAFFILPIFIFTDKKDFKRGFIAFLIPLMATVLIILVRHAKYGFHFRKVELAIGDIYYNHVEYSSIISIFFPAVCVALPLARNRSLVTKGIILGLIVILLPAIYFTYARAALVGLFFALVVAIAIRIRLANLIMPVFYAVLAFGIAYYVNNNKFMTLRPDYKHTYMHRDFADHIEATFKGQDMSSMERLYRWVAAIRMSQDEPIKGYGPNAFYYYYKPYAVPSFKTYVSRNFEHSTTHNYYLYLLVEQGWPAMILYAVLVAAVLAIAQRTYHRFRKYDRYYMYCTLGAITMFAVAFINNFFSDLVEGHKIGSLFYITIALIVILDKKSRDMEQAASKEAAIRTL